MPPLSPKSQALNKEIKRLKTYYQGTYGGVYGGHTANARIIAGINKMIQELQARIRNRAACQIQSAVRRRQRTARAHTRNRAPANLVLQAAMHPRFVVGASKKYGFGSVVSKFPSPRRN